MIFSSRAMLQSGFFCMLILMGSSSCVEVNITVTNEKTDARKNGIEKTPEGLEIEVHTAADILLPQDEADRILEAANTVALTNTFGDTNCSTGLKRNGGVGKFDAPQIIWDQTDLNTLNNTYAGVKVVKEIWACEGDGGDDWSYYGCQKDDGIVVVRPDPDSEGILWLHEIGHFFGLEHRNQPLAVMNEVIESKNKNLNPDECARYQ